MTEEKNIVDTPILEAKENLNTSPISDPSSLASPTAESQLVEVTDQMKKLIEENKNLLKGYIQRGSEIAKLMSELSRLESIIFELQNPSAKSEANPDPISVS